MNVIKIILILFLLAISCAIAIQYASTPDIELVFSFVGLASLMLIIFVYVIQSRFGKKGLKKLVSTHEFKEVEAIDESVTSVFGEFLKTYWNVHTVEIELNLYKKETVYGPMNIFDVNYLFKRQFTGKEDAEYVTERVIAFPCNIATSRPFSIARKVSKHYDRFKKIFLSLRNQSLISTGNKDVDNKYALLVDPDDARANNIKQYVDIFLELFFELEQIPPSATSLPVGRGPFRSIVSFSHNHGFICINEGTADLEPFYQLAMKLIAYS